MLASYVCITVALLGKGGVAMWTREPYAVVDAIDVDSPIAHGPEDLAARPTEEFCKNSPLHAVGPWRHVGWGVPRNSPACYARVKEGINMIRVL